MISFFKFYRPQQPDKATPCSSASLNQYVMLPSFPSPVRNPVAAGLRLHIARMALHWKCRTQSGSRSGAMHRTGAVRSTAAHALAAGPCAAGDRRPAGQNHSHATPAARLRAVFSRTKPAPAMHDRTGLYPAAQTAAESMNRSDAQNTRESAASHRIAGRSRAAAPHA